jgi:exportin-5
MAPLYGHFLAHVNQQQSDTVRYFGLGLLENSVRFKWTSPMYADTERARIKDALVDLVRCGLAPGTVEKKFIREKTAHIFAELAEREWPQRWPDLHALLFELFTTNVRLFVYCDLIKS